MFCSHPDRELSDHVCDVYSRAATFLEQMSIQDNREQWQTLMRETVLCHDFGKYTSFFQRHLRGERVGEESRHSELGAVLASFIAESRLPSGLTPRDFSYYAPLFVYFIIRQHHGDFRNFADLIQTDDRDWSQVKLLGDPVMYAQIADLQARAEEIESDLQQYVPDYAPFLNPFLENWRSHLQKMHRKLRLFAREMLDPDHRDRTQAALSLAVALQNLFSLLIDADKHSAAQNPAISRGELQADSVEAFRHRTLSQETSKQDAVRQKREQIKNIVRKRVSQIDLGQSFCTFTAPTGAGKTLTALEGALLLRERLSADGSPPRRIIYVLPFTSIIDQNYGIIEEVICPDGIDHRLVLKHHYLSDIEYKTRACDRESSLDKQLLYIESWESEIIVTTYVQWLHTLLGIKNRQLKKLHNLAGGITILDEVQNIPYRYWKLTRELCREYSRQFDNKWILLTATQPHIFPKEETTEWLDHPQWPNEHFFRNTERTSLQLAAFDYLELDAWLDKAVELASEAQSVLIITNTISTSLSVYRHFAQHFGEDVFYLSANLIPYHRRQVLEKLRKRLEKQGGRTILVSTQVVEAGVDLDFQRVIRDLGPIDSIIQASGRCNRHGERPVEHVFVLPLCKRSASKPDSFMIYGIDAVKALEVLKLFQKNDRRVIPESHYKELVDEYYRQIALMREESASTKRLEQLASLSFDLLGDFSLIEEKGEACPVFVQFDQEAVKLWEYYCTHVVSETDWRIKRENYLRCKARLKEYQVDISKRTLRHHTSLHPQHGFILIRHEWLQSGQYYDRTTGFVIDPQDEKAFML